MIRRILAVLGGLVLVGFLLAQCGVPIPGFRPVVVAQQGPATAAQTQAQAQAQQQAAQAAPASQASAQKAQEALLVGKPGASFSLNGVKLLTLPVQPGENCDQVKVGVGNTATYDVVMTDGVSVVIDAVQVNDLFNVKVDKNGVAWKKGPWQGKVTVLDGAFCPVPTEWFDWALTHRQDVLSSIRVRYGLTPRGFPVVELK